LRTGHLAPRVLWPQNRTPLTQSTCRAQTADSTPQTADACMDTVTLSGADRRCLHRCP